MKTKRWKKIPILHSSFQVCDDIDECKDPNSGCAANSICSNSVVRPPIAYHPTTTHTHMAHVGQLFHLKCRSKINDMSSFLHRAPTTAAAVTQVSQEIK